MPKLGSKKTRTGCTRCRQRRVKCDEQKPQCSNCTRLKLAESCRYTPNPSTSTKRERLEPHHAGRTTPKTLDHEHSSLDVPPAGLRQSQSPSTQSIESSTDAFSVFDMELFHHFMTQTRLTLGGSTYQHAMEHLIPKLAFSNTYLLRGLIAMAALDKGFDAEKSDREKYVHKAQQSLQYGYPLLQSLIMNINTESPESIAIYAGLVAMNALAVPALRFKGLPLENALNVFAEACVLMHGTSTVTNISVTRMEDGPMRSFFAPGVYKDIENERLDRCKPLGLKTGANAHLNLITVQVAKVRHLISPGSPLADRMEISDANGESSDSPTPVNYKHYLMILKRICESILSLPDPTSSPPSSGVHREPSPVNIYLVSFLAQIESDFLAAFRAKEPPALIVIAYFSLLLRKDNWFCGDWRDWLLGETSGIDLPEQWIEHLDWIKEKANEGP